MSIKVTHLTSAHTRYDSRIFIKECISLSDIGYNTSLIVADGLQDEVRDNVKIYNVNNGSNNRISRILKSSFLVYKKAKSLNSDIYHFHDPELIPYALLLSFSGKKVVYDIHEDLTQQILIKTWIPGFLRKPTSFLFSKIEAHACKKFYSLVVPQDEMQSKFLKYNKYTYTLYNFPTKNKNNKISFNRKDPYQLIYAGSIGESRGIFNMLDLILELQKINPKYKLVIAGNISESLLKELKLHDGWKYVNYKGVLNTENLYKFYAESSIGLILFNNVGQYYMSYALKLFEYMQNGLTVIMPNFGQWVTFNNENNVGYCVNVKDAPTTAKIISELSHLNLESFCTKNQKKCNENFTWEIQTHKFDYIYNH